MKFRRHASIQLAMVAVVTLLGPRGALAQRASRHWEINPAASMIRTAPVPRDSVQVLPSTQFIPFRWYGLRTLFLGSRVPASVSPAELASYVDDAAAFGANTVIIRPVGDGYEVVAALITSEPLPSLAPADDSYALDVSDTADPVGEAAPSRGTSTGGSSASGCVGTCSVHVRGYTRRDGTYVRPHTRNAPGSGRRRP